MKTLAAILYGFGTVAWTLFLFPFLVMIVLFVAGDASRDEQRRERHGG